MLLIILLLPGPFQGLGETLVPRESFPMVYLRGKIFILGGRLGLDGTSSVLVSTSHGSDWEEEEAPLAIPRYGHTAVTTETLQCN